MEPSEAACVCVHQHLVVEAPLACCLWIQKHGALWSVDNAAMTFLPAADGYRCQSKPPT